MADYASLGSEDGQEAEEDKQNQEPCLPKTWSEDAPNQASQAEVLDARGRKCWHKLFPAASLMEYKEILKQLLTLSWPVCVYMVATLFLPMISIIFSGHLGSNEIVASSLAQSVVNVFWRGPMLGFTSGADTLFSQTYGSANKKRVGIIFQRFLILTTLLSIVCSGFLINTKGVLLLCSQDPYISQLAHGYGLIFIAALPADTVFALLLKYLQCQSIVHPPLIVVILLGGINIVLHFVTVSALQMGLLGAAVAQVITFYLGVIFLVAYIYKRKIYKETWPGWSWDCLQEWGSITKLSIAGMGIVCVEWCCFEACFFIAGVFSNTAVGAHAVLINTSGLTWSVSTGFGIGASIMIGNYLGSNQPTKAQITTWLCIIIGVILGILYTILFCTLKHVIGYIFTSDIDVILLVISVTPAVALGQICDSGNAACYGIIRGCGYQKIGAVICILGYMIGLPFGVTLMFYFDYGLRGLWLGMFAALTVQFLLLLGIILLRINWNDEVEKAQKRAAVLPINTEIPLVMMVQRACSTTNINCVEQLEQDIAEKSSEGEDGGAVDSMELRQRECSPDDVYTEVSTTPKGVNDERKVDGEREEKHCSDDENGIRHTVRGDRSIRVVAKTRLSFSQLLFRRGLLLCFCLSVMTVSIIVSLYIVPAVSAIPPSDPSNSTSSYSTDYQQDLTGTEF